MQGGGGPLQISTISIDRGIPCPLGLTRCRRRRRRQSAQEVLRLPTVRARTGVKHLHRAAEAYDVAVYFEANGHGSVLFSAAALDAFRRIVSGIDAGRFAPPPAGADAAACRRSASTLLHLDGMINPAVGDGLSGLLLVDVALRMRGWSPRDWLGLYADLPARQLKAAVPDRRAVVVDARTEERVLEPPGLQAAIDACVAEAANGLGADGGDERPRVRCFARPSGTEDVVRVYAESPCESATLRLCEKVRRLVEERLGGAGADAAMPP